MNEVFGEGFEFLDRAQNAGRNVADVHFGNFFRVKIGVVVNIVRNTAGSFARLFDFQIFVAERGVGKSVAEGVNDRNVAVFRAAVAVKQPFVVAVHAAAGEVDIRHNIVRAVGEGFGQLAAGDGFAGKKRRNRFVGAVAAVTSVKNTFYQSFKRGNVHRAARFDDHDDVFVDARNVFDDGFVTGVKADIFAVHRFADEGSVFAHDDHHLIGSRGAFDGGAGIDQSAHMPGVSVVKGTGLFFDDLLNEHKEELLGNRKYDCLVKFLDSATRLPFQVHPTKDFSRQYFNSEYGKTEAWLVIATRPGAKLYFGFKDKITKEELSALEERSEVEKDIMGNLLAGVEVQVGDLWLIRAGLIHAIGTGCTIIEVQEPTDFTIQPERWCGDYHISYNEEYIGLDKDVALDAINYDIYGDAAKAYAKVSPKTVVDTEKYKKEVLIGYDDTPCFAEVRHTVQNGGSFVMSYAPAVYICLEGNGQIVGENYKKDIKRGDYFYLPYVAEGKYSIVSDTKAVLVECLPSKQD